MDQLLVFLIVAPVGALYLAAIIYAIAQITRTESLNQVERWVWALAVIIVPFIASLVWFIAGPHPFGLKITTSWER